MPGSCSGHAGPCLLRGGILSHHPILGLCSQCHLLSLFCRLRVSWALVGRAPLCTVGLLYEAASPWRAELWEAALETHRQETAVTPTATWLRPWSHSTALLLGADPREGCPALPLPSPSICFLSCRSVWLKSSGPFDVPLISFIVMGLSSRPFLLFH